jgi:AGZA family xanthine/uracil permease-like MFS transporter
MLEKYFRLSEHQTTGRTEVLAGVTTFLTMSYIIFVNPNILATTGMDKGALFVATCIAAAIGCLIMAFVANWPIGLAPSMGLNAYFAFTVVAQLGFTWQQALGAVFISGVVFIIITVTGVREWLIDGIAASLRCGVVAGIGLFLGIIALKTAGVVVPNKATIVGMGDLTNLHTLYAILGFFIITALDALRVRGSILIGIIAITILSMITGQVQYQGFISMPPSIAPGFFQLDIMGALSKGFFHIIIVFVLVEIFDATGTMIGIATRAGLVTPTNPGRLGRALFADSIAIVFSSFLGTSSTTAYIESASGVQAGGRTGLTAVVIAILFLLALFLSPLAAVVPGYATAPALLYVACLMLRELVHVNWDDITDTVPAVIAAITMPLTYSIANGLAFGFISYVAIKAITGRVRDIHPAALLVAILFVIKYAFFPD